jgi:hypothetical protein
MIHWYPKSGVAMRNLSSSCSRSWGADLLRVRQEVAEAAKVHGKMLGDKWLDKLINGELLAIG